MGRGSGWANHLDREILKARRERRDFSDLQAQKDAADAEMDRLIDLEPEPARIDYDDTRQTFQEWWDTHDTAAVLSRPDMLFSVAAIERPGTYAILYMGDPGELLNRASDLSITINA
jgi:hypothetical protein